MITQATDEKVELVAGKRGEFSVRVDDQIVAAKGFLGFPSENDVVERVATALKR